ncbi:MAG: TolC family protein, partial [Proteobacteria bacterium]|nr:TolC family protein [Pseudomonadota bacterium]
GASRRRDPVPDIGIIEKYDIQFAASWEVDFWGRYRDATVAAREQLLASETNREALRLSLASQVAQSWYAWQSLAQRVALQQRTLAAQQDELRLVGRRVAAGLLGEFELRQLEAEVAGTRSNLNQLEAARDREQNALGILLGRTPQALATASLPASGEIVAITPPALLPAALPSTRLLARPDVQAAEAGLRAANARIGVARSAWFPAISLTASAGTVSAELSGRRGRVTGTDSPQPGWTEITSVVPMAEMEGFESRLKSISGGDGSCSIAFSHYEAAPGEVQQRLAREHAGKRVGQ